jgi:hypothetical protein
MTTVTKKTKVKKATKGKKAPAKKLKKKSGERGIIEQIIDLHKTGKTNKDIIDMGYSKSTVGQQVAKFKREKAEKKK